MIEININWIKELIKVENIGNNTYGVIRFSEVDLEKWIDDGECVGDISKKYHLAVERMIDHDLINMRDNENGEEIF